MEQHSKNLTPNKNNTMKTWLKLIGSASNPITEWKEKYVGFRRKGMPSILTGDLLFLYAPGGGRIFALAEAVDVPKDDPDYNQDIDGSCRWKLPVRYFINLPVAAGILLDDVRCNRDLRLSVRQAGHLGLLEDEGQLADRKLHEADRKFQEKQSA